MYDLAAYRSMIQDRVRTDAYAAALQAAIRPGDTVVEVGTGIGFFAVLACRAGASRVVAIEPDAAIAAAMEVARANGVEDRIDFVHDLSTRVAAEPADVLCSDLRGVLPLFGLHLPAVVDARTRLLKPGGIQIPQQDRLWMALAETPASPGAPAEEPAPHGIDLAPVHRLLAHAWGQRRASPAELLGEPRSWGELDYRTVTGPDLEGAAELTAARDGTAHGILTWFETRLFGAHGFTTAPGAPETIYGQAFFPLPGPIRLARGDVLAARLEARLVGGDYVWRWSGSVLAGASRGERFDRHSLLGAALSPAALRKRADRFVPRLQREGEAQAWMLSRMDGIATLEAIAREAAVRFPDLYPSYLRALAEAGEVSERFSR